jgi:hypothetical protein
VSPVNPEFPFIPPNASSAVAYQLWADIPLRQRIINALNELESFAQYFENDLADEAIAFTPTGQAFCIQCEILSIYIGIFRQENNFKLYQNLAKLYAQWKPRVERTVLDEQGKVLQTLKSKLPPDERRPCIGTKL